MQEFDCLLLRHGEPDCASDIYLGHTDPHLSKEGAERCLLTAQWAKTAWTDFQPKQIYTSGLRRAIESAEAIRPAYMLDVEQDPDINEIYFGEWEGLPFTEVERSLPGALERWFGDPLNQPAPGGEDFYQLAERVDRFLARDLMSPCIIVAHYCSIAVLASRLLSVPLSHADRLALHRGSCGRIKNGHLVSWGMPADV